MTRVPRFNGRRRTRSGAAALVLLACAACGTRSELEPGAPAHSATLDAGALDAAAIDAAAVEPAPPVADAASTAPLGCAPGAPPVVVADHLAEPRALVLAAWDVYFEDRVVTGPGAEMGALRRVSKEGGTVETLVRGIADTADVALGDGVVAWLPLSVDEVHMESLENGASRVLFAGPVGGAARGIAADRNFVYWGFQPPSGPDADGVVRRVPRDGGAPTVLGRGAALPSFAADDTHVYWLGHDGVHRARKDGMGMSRLVVSDQGTIAFALAPGAIVTLRSTPNGTSRAIVRWPASGRPPEVLVSSDAPIARLRAFGDHVYYTVARADSGAIVRVPLAGGAPVAVASSRVSPRGAPALDDTCVYWIEGGAGTSSIARAAR